MPERPDDVRRLWQEQAREQRAPSIEEIRKMTRTLEMRIHRRNLREYVAGAVTMVAFGWVAWNDSSTIVRLGASLLIAGVGFVLYYLRRHGTVEAGPADLGLIDSRAFHRQQLVRQRDLLKNVWTWYLLPLVPGMALLFVGGVIARPDHLVGATLSAAAVAVLFYGIGKLNEWAAKTIQKSIDDLE